jgi:hypothetical protein
VLTPQRTVKPNQFNETPHQQNQQKTPNNQLLQKVKRHRVPVEVPYQMLWRKEEPTTTSSNNNNDFSLEYIQYVIYKGGNEHYGLILLENNNTNDGNSKKSENPETSRQIVISELLNDSPAFNCLKEGDILEEVYIDDSGQLITPSVVGIERLNRLVQTSKSRLTVTISRKTSKAQNHRNQNLKNTNFQYKIGPESPKDSDEVNIYRVDSLTCHEMSKLDFEKLQLV